MSQHEDSSIWIHNIFVYTKPVGQSFQNRNSFLLIFFPWTWPIKHLQSSPCLSQSCAQFFWQHQIMTTFPLKIIVPNHSNHKIMAPPCHWYSLLLISSLSSSWHSAPWPCLTILPKFSHPIFKSVRKQNTHIDAILHF